MNLVEATNSLPIFSPSRRWHLFSSGTPTSDKAPRWGRPVHSKGECHETAVSALMMPLRTWGYRRAYYRQARMETGKSALGCRSRLSRPGGENEKITKLALLRNRFVSPVKKSLFFLSYRDDGHSGHCSVEYLAETITAIIDGHPQSQIEDLMPWRFRKTSAPSP